MSVIVRHAICCDSCKRRFEPSFESLPNKRGITKASGTIDARREAMLAGWTKRKAMTRYGLILTIDLCKDCKPYSMDGRTIWFQSPDNLDEQSFEESLGLVSDVADSHTARESDPVGKK